MENYLKKILKNIKKASKKVNPFWVLLILNIVYVFVLCVISIDHYNRFRFFAFDLGIFDQGAWLISQLKNPFVTVRGFNIFGDHIQFILLLVAPFYWIWSDARILLILQTMTLSAGSLPIYLLAKNKLKDRWIGLVFVMMYFLFPALLFLNLDNFHPVSFVVPFLLFAFYFASIKRSRLFLLFIILALISKEEVALTTFVLGIYVAMKFDKKFGVLASMISIIWLLFSLYLILPYFNGVGYFHAKHGYDAFGELGKTPHQFVINLITKPNVWIDKIISKNNGVYLFNIFAPLGFISIFNPLTLILTAPSIFINFITGWAYAKSIKYHYTATIIPFVFISAIYGLHLIKNLIKKRIRRREKILGEGIFIAIIVIMLICSILANIYIGPSETSIKNVGKFIQIVKSFRERNKYEKNIYNSIEMIPSDASVSASYNIVPHITHRKIIYMFPNPFKESYWGVMSGNFTPPRPTEYTDYIILDMFVTNENEYNEIITKFLNHGIYYEFYKNENILIFKRNENNTFISYEKLP